MVQSKTQPYYIKGDLKATQNKSSDFPFLLGPLQIPWDHVQRSKISKEIGAFFMGEAEGLKKSYNILVLLTWIFSHLGYRGYIRTGHKAIFLYSLKKPVHAS